jgi:hypothetical protein
MPRYLVERSFTDGLHIPIDAIGAKTCAEVVGTNLDHGVTWVHSYVTPDKTKLRPTAFTTRPAPKPSARAPRPTTSRSTGSPRSGSWTPTSTPSAGERAVDNAGPTGSTLRRSCQGSREHSHPHAPPDPSDLSRQKQETTNSLGWDHRGHSLGVWLRGPRPRSQLNRT